MIICESEFVDPDPNDPDIAMTEVDIYAWIPRTPGMPNHRLTIRKRLTTGNYEVYRKFVKREVQDFPDAVMISHRETGTEVVAFADPSLEKAIEFANTEAIKYHGPGMTEDKVCRHRLPQRAMGCKLWMQEAMENG